MEAGYAWMLMLVIRLAPTTSQAAELLSHTATRYPLHWLQVLLESELDALQRMRKTEPVRQEIAALQEELRELSCQQSQ